MCLVRPLLCSCFFTLISCLPKYLQCKQSHRLHTSIICSFLHSWSILNSFVISRNFPSSIHLKRLSRLLLLGWWDINPKLAEHQRQIVEDGNSCIILMLFPRSRLGVHCIPSSCRHDASSPTVVHLFLYHAHSLGSGHTSKIHIHEVYWEKKICTFGNVLTRPFSVQFVAMEVVMTSIIDMFPTKMRRAGRRELLLLLFCLTCFLSQLVMITEVSSYMLMYYVFIHQSKMLSAYNDITTYKLKY